MTIQTIDDKVLVMKMITFDDIDNPQDDFEKGYLYYINPKFVKYGKEDNMAEDTDLLDPLFKSATIAELIEQKPEGLRPAIVEVINQLFAAPNNVALAIRLKAIRNLRGFERVPRIPKV